MDPLCHTLVGTTLAARFRERSWGAAATVVVAANLPDVDVLAYAWGSDAALGFRRGWTHGAPALVVWPLLLTAAVWAWGRWRGAEGLRPGRLLALAVLALLTHPALDWLNTYGMRWLAPFDDRWFYGDTLFIVDPWMWLILGGASFLAFSRTPRATAAWLGLAAVASVPVLFAPALPSGARAAWLAGIAALALARRLCGPAATARRHRIAAAGLALALLYVGGMWAAHAVAVEQVEAAVGTGGAGGGDTEREVYVGPLPGRTLLRDVLVVTGGDGYRPGRVHPVRGVELGEATMARNADDPRAAAALAAPCVAGMVRWMRYPFFVVEEGAEETLVHVLDARYLREPGPGFGATAVVLGPGGRPRGCR